MKVHLDIWTECNSWSRHMEKSHLRSVDPSLSFWWWSPIAINSDTSSMLLFYSLWKAIPLAGCFLETLLTFWTNQLKGILQQNLHFNVGVKGNVKRLHYGCIWFCKMRDGFDHCRLWITANSVWTTQLAVVCTERKQTRHQGGRGVPAAGAQENVTVRHGGKVLGHWLSYTGI